MRKKATGRPFVSGDKRAGRPRGSLNKATVKVREWASALVEDEQVQGRILEQARAGKLPPGVFCELLHYAYGKPRETMVNIDTRSLTDQQLERIANGEDPTAVLLATTRLVPRGAP